MEETKDSIIVEREVKNMLTREEYEKLIHSFGITEEDIKPQTNAYFDTVEWELNFLDTTLRVRAKKDRLELTLKEDKGQEGKPETTYSPFSDEEYRRLRDEGIIPESEVLKALEERLNVKGPYLHQGDLITHRAEIFYQGCIIALDHSLYLGTEDFELEVEKPKDNSKGDENSVMAELRSKFRIPRRKAPGKRGRFFDFIASQKISIT